MPDTRPPLLLGFDFEDWNQLAHRHLGLAGWDAPNAAFERQMGAIFPLLDELEARATFFLLGLSAKNYPHLVEEIVARGHEAACHGYAHDRVYNQTPDEFRRDVEAGSDLIERIAGRRPVGYRAPAFSITRDTSWAYEALTELGFRYDSSQYDSPRIPRRLGPIPNAPYLLRSASGREIWEFPIAVWRRGRWSLPVGGGSYWRVLPARLLTRGLVADSVLYFHPYEFDPSPLRPVLPEAAAAAQRLRGIYRRLRANPGRGRVPVRLREIARHFRLVSYEDAYEDIAERYGGRTRTLSAEGVLV